MLSEATCSGTSIWKVDLCVCLARQVSHNLPVIASRLPYRLRLVRDLSFAHKVLLGASANPGKRPLAPHTSDPSRSFAGRSVLLSGLPSRFNADGVANKLHREGFELDDWLAGMKFVSKKKALEATGEKVGESTKGVSGHAGLVPTVSAGGAVVKLLE